MSATKLLFAHLLAWSGMVTGSALGLLATDSFSERVLIDRAYWQLIAVLMIWGLQSFIWSKA